MLAELINKQNTSNNLNNKQVIVVSGGISSEKDVSLETGKAVFNALVKENIKVVNYIVKNNLIELLDFLVNIKDNSIIFNALHGGMGENGGLSTLLDILCVPYTHSKAGACAVAMNKHLTKQIAKANNILVAKGILINTVKCIENNNILEKFNLHFPLVVKPNSEGSSIGVHIANNKDELLKALSLSLNYEEIILEEFLPENEFSVGVVNGKALEITLIQPSPNNSFYNYEAKYAKGGSFHTIAANINNDLRNYMLNSSEQVYKILGCKGVARVDFKEKNGKAYLLEVNTHPGLTSTSLLPEQAEYCNVSFSKLCLFLLQDAISR